MRTIQEGLAKAGVGGDHLGGAARRLRQLGFRRARASRSRTLTGAVGTRNCKVYIPSGYTPARRCPSW
ncbi:hypothetical protein ACU4GA_31155 [Methylobacterium oryzae CBMB20]